MNLVDLIQVIRGLASTYRSQWHDAARIERDQSARLSEQLDWARRQVGYYRNLPTIENRAQLHQLPIVRRATIQAQTAAFLAGGKIEPGWHESHTSGSLAQPLVSWFDPATWRLVKYVLKMRRLLVWGWKPNDNLVIVDDVPDKDVEAHTRAFSLPGERLVGTRHYLSLFELPENHLDAYAKLRPRHIYGPPSYFAELAKVWNDDLRRQVPLKTIMTSSEMLSASARRQLQEIFQAAVLDVYGSTEFKEIAWQCPRGEGYHINHESVIVEICDSEGRPVADGTVGEVVVTSLTNRAMPLIRYGTEDYASKMSGRCGCGRESERLKNLSGRSVDHVPIPGLGNITPYEITTVVSHINELLKYKIVQQSDHSLDVSIMLKSGASGSSLVGVKSALDEIVAGKVAITVREVDSIDYGGSRKHKPIEVYKG